MKGGHNYSDEFELEFPKLSQADALKVPRRAKLGHLNLRAESQLLASKIVREEIILFLFYIEKQ